MIKSIHRKKTTKKESERDFFQTPYCVTEALCDHLLYSDHRLHSRKETVLDPCCGDGAITKVLEYHFDTVKSIDKFDKDNPQDFLEWITPVNTVIMNPPYSQKNAFIDHALSISDNVYVLLPTGVDAYISFNEDYKNTSNYEGRITTYPKLFMSPTLEGDGTIKQGGVSCYAWYHFTNKEALREKYEFLYDVRDYFESVKKYLT